MKSRTWSFLFALALAAGAQLWSFFQNSDEYFSTPIDNLLEFVITFTAAFAAGMVVDHFAGKPSGDS